MNYTIQEVYDIICDLDNILTLVFKVEGDGDDYYRELVDSDYYNWCYEHYVTDGQDFLEYVDDEEFIPDYFGYDKWNIYYSNVDMVTEYIYMSYTDLKYLPSPKKDK
jgi:hypothetical protein